MKGGIWCCMGPRGLRASLMQHCIAVFYKMFSIGMFLICSNVSILIWEGWNKANEVACFPEDSESTWCIFLFLFYSFVCSFLNLSHLCSISVRLFHFFLLGMFLICKRGKVVVYWGWCCIRVPDDAVLLFVIVFFFLHKIFNIGMFWICCTCPRGLRLPLMQSIRGCCPIQGPPSIAFLLKWIREGFI